RNRAARFRADRRRRCGLRCCSSGAPRCRRAGAACRSERGGPVARSRIAARAACVHLQPLPIGSPYPPAPLPSTAARQASLPLSPARRRTTLPARRPPHKRRTDAPSATVVNVSWTLLRPRGLIAIAEALVCLDRLAFGCELPDLGTQAAHVAIDVAFVVCLGARTQGLEQLLTAEDALRLTQQVRKKMELVGRQLERYVAVAHLQARRVDPEVAGRAPRV